MSRLQLLLATASRQFARLTLNRQTEPTSVLKNNLHCTSCMRVDLDNLMETKDQKTTQNQAKEPQKRWLSEAPIDPDYLPGGPYIPSQKTLTHMVDGVRYDRLPRVCIKASYQNTIISAFQKGKSLSIQSGGTVGFKNAKKRSTVCAQTVGLAVGMDLIKKGHKNVCVIVSGQGTGRLPAIKGVQLAGCNIVSITDKTFPSVTQRPRKAKRL